MGFLMSDARIDKADKILGIIQKFVTISAIIIGGVWTYNLFIIHREAYPKAEIDIEVIEQRISDDHIFLQVSIKIENIGNTILRLRECDVRLFDVSFDNKLIEREINEYREPTLRRQKDYAWKLIQRILLDWEEGLIEIEPSDSDTIDFEFIIKSKYKTIKVYSWFKDYKKKEVGKKDIGWTATRMYNIKS